MIQTVEATYSDGVFKPSEPLDLADGTEVTLSITDRKVSDEDVEASMSAAGGWRGKVDAAKLKREIYESRRLMTRPVPKM